MFKKLLGALALIIGFAVPAVAQGDSMPTQVLSDRVVIGPQFAHRYLEATSKLLVLSGTQTLPANSTFDYIEVSSGATLTCDPTRSTTVRVITLMILPGGHFTCDLSARPDLNLTVIIRDVPLNTALDPYQWGNGLENFGNRTLKGVAKLIDTTSTGSIHAGDTSLTLNGVLTGWRVGDELLLPDTNPPAVNGVVTPRREAKVTITGISGQVVTLSKSLDFDHANIIKPDGNTVLSPRVLNLTRNIVITSENPTGTRGHTADIGHDASWDVEYIEESSMGRTLNIPIDDTTADSSGNITHIGTNVKAKYNDHDHHVMMGNGSIKQGLVLRGNGPTSGKWGMVVHASHFTNNVDNIAIDFAGAGFITEDGYEYGNIFKHNIAAYNLGTYLNSSGDAFSAQDNINLGCFGCDGAGFWFHGIMNYFDSNEAWNNNNSGMLFINQQLVIANYPTTPGGMADTALNPYINTPLSLVNNITAANKIRGFELWGTSKYPNDNLISWNNGMNQYEAFISEHISVYLRNPLFGCQPNQNARSAAIVSSSGYAQEARIEGGEMRGCGLGISGGGGVNGIFLFNTIMQNAINIDTLARVYEQTNVMHIPLGTNPPHYIDFTAFSTVWPGVGNPPDTGVSFWAPSEGSRYIAYNWQGTGQDYRFFYKQSFGSSPAWPSMYDATHLFDCPLTGVTMMQCWNQLGLAFQGEAVPDANALTLEGIWRGYALPGAHPTLGTPKTIVTFPMFGGVPRVVDTYIDSFGVLTGDTVGMSTVALYTVDGSPIITATAPTTSGGVEMWTSPYVNSAAPGLHTLTTWRSLATSPNVPVANTRYDSTYCIGSNCGTTPPPTTCQDPTATNFGGPLPCTYPAPPPPINCVVGSWGALSSNTTDTPAVTSGGFQTRTETTIVQEQRAIITQPANGGTACPLQ